MFLSRRCVYIIALSLENKLDDKVKTMRIDRFGKEVPDNGCPQTVRGHLRYWLRCLNTFACPVEEPRKNQASPSILIVCTHKDKCTSEQVESYIKSLRIFFEEDKCACGDNVPEIVTISNKEPDKQDVKVLREAIINLASCKEYKYDLPLKWINFKEKLLQSADKDLPIKTFKETESIALGVGMDPNHIKTALLLYHELGDLIFFDEPLLKDFIVCHPQWLINQIRKVITVEACLDKATYSKKWKHLEETGVLHKDLVEAVWGGKAEEQLLELMRKFALLLEIPEHYIHGGDESDDSKKSYLVPCFLPILASESSALQGDRNIAPLFLVPPNRFMPVGLTSRLFAGLVNEEEWKVVGKIYGDAADFSPKTGNKDPSIEIRILQKAEYIELQGTHLTENCGDEFSKALSDIRERLRFITKTVCPLKELKVQMACPICPTLTLNRVIDEGGKVLKEAVNCRSGRHRFTTSTISCWFNMHNRVGIAPAAVAQDYEWNSDLEWKKPKQQFSRLRQAIARTSDSGKPVVIALLDSGIRKEHPDLLGSIEVNRNFIGEEKEGVFHPNENEDDDLDKDLFNHGTMSAGILCDYAGKENIKILNLKVVNKTGGGDWDCL